MLTHSRIFYKAAFSLNEVYRHFHRYGVCHQVQEEWSLCLNLNITVASFNSMQIYFNKRGLLCIVIELLMIFISNSKQR